MVDAEDSHQGPLHLASCRGPWPAGVQGPAGERTELVELVRLLIDLSILDLVSVCKCKLYTTVTADRHSKVTS